MDRGEYGALVPAGQARQQLQMTAEALRRFGDAAEGLLCCPLPTSTTGGRQYPEQLLILMAEARAEKAARRAVSQEAALAKLLSQAGWIDDTPDEEGGVLGDMTVLRELVADLQTLKRSLAGVAPGLLGAAEEQREVADEMLEIMRRTTLELPQVQHHLERMQANHTAQADSTLRIGQQALELIHHTADLHRPQRALELELVAIRRTLQGVMWGLGLGGLGIVGLLVLRG
ncbi:hypothetical protein DEMA109039_12580 [Deinococcus marmoris]